MASHPCEHQSATDDGHHRHPLVPAKSCEFVGTVDAHSLDPEPADAVADDVHHEQLARRRTEPLVDPDEQQTQPEAPQRFVQERRVERGAHRVDRRVEVDRIDLEPPRQIGGTTEEFLIEVVAPSPDRLCERNCRRRARRSSGHRDAALLREVQPDRDAEQQSAGNAQAALPDLRNATEVVGEQIPVGGDVIQPCADDSGDHRPDRDRTGIVTCADLTLLQPPTEQPHGCDHAERDHQPVQIEAQWPDVDGVERRARDGGQGRCQHGWSRQLAVTRATNSPAIRSMSAAS